MKRILKWLVMIVLVLLLAVVLLWWWLSGTRSGAQWALGQAQSRVELFEWRSLSGSISDGLVLEDVVFSQAGLDAELERLELALGVRPGRPLRVTVKKLYVDGVEVQLPEPQPQQQTEPFVLGNYSLPITLNLQDVRVRDLVIQTAATEEPVAPIEIQRLELAGLVHNALLLDRLELDSAPYQLRADGSQDLAEPWASDLNLQLGWQLDQTTDQQLDLNTEGDLEALIVKISANGPVVAEASIKLEHAHRPEALSADVELTGQLEGWPNLPLALQQIELKAEGSMGDWQTDFNTDAIWAELPPASLDLRARGSDRSIEIERGVVEVFDGTVAISGQADIVGQTQALARIELDQLDFTALYPDWPQQARLSGSMDVQLDQDRLEVANLNLNAPPSALSVAGQAQMNLQTQALSTRLEWQSLTWPPVLAENEVEPLFSSESGTFEASGTLDDWQAELDALLTLPDVLDQPEAALNLNANGTADEVSQFDARLESQAAGALSISGSAGFDGRVSADLNLQQFNPAALARQWPGQIDGQLRVRIDQAQPLSADLLIDELDGRLRSLPLVGSGGLSLQAQAIQRADLNISWGESALELQSENGQRWLLQADAPDLNQLWPELTGDLALTASAMPEQGTVEWQMRSEEVSWGDYRANALDIEAQLEGVSTAGGKLTALDPSIEFALTATNVDLNPWERLETFSLNLNGSCNQHSLRTEFSGSRAAMVLAADGALPECLQNMSHWQGRLNRFDLTETAWGDWRLVDPMPIAVLENAVDIGAACLEADQSNGALCLNELRASRSGTAAIALQQLPIDLLLLPANPPFRIGSRLDGEFSLGWAANGLQRIDGELVLGPGALRTLFGEGDLLAIEQVELVLDSNQNTSTATGTEARLNAQLEGQTTLTAEAQIPDLTDLASMQLDADLNLDLPDLGAFNRLVPQLDELSGRVQGELSVRGPVTDPALNGQLSLRQGRLLHAPLGSRIEQIELDLSTNQNRADLSGQFTAGEGQASIQGAFNAGSSTAMGWQGQLAVDGENLQLFKVDWLSLTLSPDLQVGLTEDELNLDGRLVIDRARLGLPPGAETQVQPSLDVVIVGAEPEDETEADPDALRAISGELQLVLGDDVRLEAAGMETELAGELDIVWRPETPMPIARGMIELIDGAYSAYGQNLEVETGEVQFTGQPIDNPQLDIEAVREIFGDTQVEKAGLRIRGAARNPEITLFTSPPTSREKALAYVLTGADFDHAGGQGAFNVGFWVLPSVFVSYGLGLFDSGNVLAARWELSRRWGIRATSGERDTGADISFLIDR